MIECMVLEVDGVDLVREGKLLLENVSLTVAAGEHWTLLGPNGAVNQIRDG